MAPLAMVVGVAVNANGLRTGAMALTAADHGFHVHKGNQCKKWIGITNFTHQPPSLSHFGCILDVCIWPIYTFVILGPHWMVRVSWSERVHKKFHACFRIDGSSVLPSLSNSIGILQVNPSSKLNRARWVCPNYHLTNRRILAKWFSASGLKPNGWKKNHAPKIEKHWLLHQSNGHGPKYSGLFWNQKFKWPIIGRTGFQCWRLDSWIATNLQHNGSWHTAPHMDGAARLPQLMPLALWGTPGSSHSQGWWAAMPWNLGCPNHKHSQQKIVARKTTSLGLWAFKIRPKSKGKSVDYATLARCFRAKSQFCSSLLQKLPMVHMQSSNACCQSCQIRQPIKVSGYNEDTPYGWSAPTYMPEPNLVPPKSQNAIWLCRVKGSKTDTPKFLFNHCRASTFTLVLLTNSTWGFRKPSDGLPKGCTASCPIAVVTLTKPRAFSIR